MNKQDEIKRNSWGGKRPNAGRKKRMEESEVIAKLEPMNELAFSKLAEKIEEGDINAIKIFLAYYLGQPTQRVESKVEGNLSQISVEVVRPVLVDSQSN